MSRKPPHLPPRLCAATPQEIEESLTEACRSAHGDLVSRVMSGMESLLEAKLGPVTDAQRTTGQALELLLKMAHTDAEERAEFRARLEALEEWRGRVERASRNHGPTDITPAPSPGDATST